MNDQPLPLLTEAQRERLLWDLLAAPFNEASGVEELDLSITAEPRFLNAREYAHSQLLPRHCGYRIFTDRDGYSSVAAKKHGDVVTVLARTDTYNEAFHAILEDAGLVFASATRDEGKNYEPKPEDWR